MASSTLPVRGRGGVGIVEKLHELLSERECSIFDKGVASYQRKKDITSFVETLTQVLNTNHKRQLLIPIRETFVKSGDVMTFNKLAVRYGIAMPTQGSMPRKLQGMPPEPTPREVTVSRGSRGEWGFSIQGGSDQGGSLVVSGVEPGSNAEQAGLLVGDVIQRVNGATVNQLTNSEVTQVFQDTATHYMLLLTLLL